MPEVATHTKVTDLAEGLSIWKTNLDALRERDRNARTMPPETFERLVENIRKTNRLESLPLCVRRTNPSGNEELQIISGHHRTRAARAAGLAEVFVMVIEEGLSEDFIKAKQLAHNALAGNDDSQILAEIYRSIADLDARIETGVLNAELDAAADGVKVDLLGPTLDFEILQIVFIPKHRRDFEEVVKLLMGQDAKDLWVAESDEWIGFRDAMRAVGRKENIKAVGPMLHRMAAIVRQWVAENPTETEQET